MKKFKCTICLLLSVIMCVAMLSGCNGGKASPSPSPSAAAPTTSAPPQATPTVTDKPVEKDAEYYDNFTLILNAAVQTLDWTNPASSNSQAGYVIHHVYDKLVNLTSDGKFEPDLATSWETTDAKTVTLKLRNDVTFHNGEKFTADDVAFTIDAGKAAKGTRLYDRWAKVESYEVVNDYEIKLTYVAPNFDYLYDLSSATNCILNREAYAADPINGGNIGTGPWIVTKMLPNDYIDFKRNENYWGEVPKTKTFTMRFVSEITARNIMVENDEVEMTNLNSAYVPQYEKHDTIDIWSYTMNNTNLFSFNMLNPITGDLNFRLAVAHAIDPQETVDFALNGYAVPNDSAATWGLYTEYKNPNLPRYPFDIAKAKEYLAKSNYKGETVVLSNTGAHAASNCEILQQQLAAIGIKCEVDTTDSPTLNAKAKWGNTDIQIIATSLLMSAASDCRNYYYPEYTSNKANYKNDKVSELIDLGNITKDPAEREKIYWEIQEIVAEELPYVSLYNMTNYYIGQKGVGGIDWYADNNHDFSQAYRVKLK